MPSQEEKALIRYEALKARIKEKKKLSGDYIFAYMFDKYGILERTSSRYLQYLKTLEYITIKGDEVFWRKQ